MSTPHNRANFGDIAEDCIICGDPLRAKYIAENFLENPKLFNDVRNCYGYTGTYKGKKISVMGHGMGMASIGIYCHELFAFYGVKNIIRAGSCGAIKSGLKLFDTIVAENAYTTSNIGEQLGLRGKNRKVLPCSKNLFEKAKKIAQGKDNYKFGDILSSDVFYTPNNRETTKYSKKGCLCVEMEAYVLYAEAKLQNKNALTIVSVSDIVGTKEETTPEQREKSFDNMINLALEILVN